MEIISPINKTYIQNQTTQQNNNVTTTIDSNLKSDEFIKNNKTKKALITGVSIIALGVTAFIFRKDISKLFNKAKDSISFTGKKIEIPSANYDLSKEAPIMQVSVNNPWSGFSDVTKYLNPDASETISLPNIEGGWIAGITKDGIAYVQTGEPTNLGIDSQYFSQIYSNTTDDFQKAFAGLTLFSTDSNFTPAQKNLIAILHQQLGHSKNSMFSQENRILYKLANNGSYEDGETFEGIFKMLATWAQDIDTNNKETRKWLKKLSCLKNGEHLSFDIIR